MSAGQLEILTPDFSADIGPLLYCQWMQPGEAVSLGTCQCLWSETFPFPTSSALRHWERSIELVQTVLRQKVISGARAILFLLHLHVPPSHCMMHGRFPLQVCEAQVGSVLHHLVHDVDVSLSVVIEVKNRDRKGKRLRLWHKLEMDAHLQPKWKAVCPASQVRLGSAPLLRKRSTNTRLPWRAA